MQSTAYCGLPIAYYASPVDFADSSRHNPGRSTLCLPARIAVTRWTVHRLHMASTGTAHRAEAVPSASVSCAERLSVKR